MEQHFVLLEFLLLIISPFVHKIIHHYLLLTLTVLLVFTVPHVMHPSHRRPCLNVKQEVVGLHQTS